jgi:hypothetical protein
MNKNNTFKLGRSIAQIAPFHRIPIKKQQHRDNHNEVGNNNGNNSDSKDCCFNVMELTGQKVEMDNRIPIIPVLI